MKTTFLKKMNVMRTEDLDHCHDGIGAIHWTCVLDDKDPGGRVVNFIHDDILPPSTSIGVHTHENDQEYYYIVSGNGVMTLDGKEHDVAAGDITVVFPGGSHGLANRSATDLRIIVISVKPEGGQR